MIVYYDLPYVWNLGYISCCRKIIRVCREYVQQVSVRRESPIIDAQAFHNFRPPVSIGACCDRTYKTWFQMLPIEFVYILYSTIYSIWHNFHGIYILCDFHRTRMSVIRFVLHGEHCHVTRFGCVKCQGIKALPLFPFIAPCMVKVCWIHL